MVESAKFDIASYCLMESGKIDTAPIVCG